MPEDSFGGYFIGTNAKPDFAPIRSRGESSHGVLSAAVNQIVTKNGHFSLADWGDTTMLTESIRQAGRYVNGPCGLLTIADLPTPGTKRWVIRRKAELVAAVRGGLLSLELACSRYALSAEEYLSWQDAIDRHGFAALRVTHLHKYRQQRDPVGEH
jgi:hypothetical protein